MTEMTDTPENPSQEEETIRKIDLPDLLRASDLMAHGLHAAWKAHRDILQALANVSGRTMYQFHNNFSPVEPQSNKR